MSSSLSDNSTFKLSKVIESMLPHDVVHLSETVLESSASSFESSRISGKASAGGVAEDIHLSVNPV